MSVTPDLQVIAPAFEECTLAFTTQGGRIDALAGRLGADCAPLGDQSVGGVQCGALSQQVTTLVRSLDAVGTGGCAGVVQVLERILGGFQQVDRAEAASPHLVPQPGGT